MRMAFAVLAALGTALAGCGPQCTLKHCDAYLTVHVHDAAGNPVPRFFGRVNLDQRRTIEFNCDAASPASTDAFDCKGSGIVRLTGLAEEQGSYSVHLVDQATSATFDGGLTPQVTSIPDFNGEGCGGCPTGEATVQLPSP